MARLCAALAFLALSASWVRAEAGQVHLGHGGWVTDVAFTADGKLLISGCLDRKVRAWDTQTWQLRWEAEVPKGLGCLAASPDGRWLALGDMAGAVSVRDPQTGSSVVTSTPLRRTWGVSPVSALAFSPDGRILAGGTLHGQLHMWDTQSWTGSRLLAGNQEESPALGSLCLAGGGVVAWLASGRSVVWRGSCLAGGGGWTVPDEAAIDAAEHVAMAPGLPGGVSSTLTADPSLVELKQHGGTRLGGVGEATCLALTADAKLGVTGEGDYAIRVWRNPDRHGASAAPPMGPPDPGPGRAPGPGELGRWDLAAELRGHTGYVSSAALTPDAERVVSAGWDDRIRLWDWQAGRELQTLECSGDVNCLAFSPDGHLLASGGDDGLVRIWEVGDRLSALEAPTGSASLPSPPRPAPTEERRLLVRWGEHLYEYDEVADGLVPVLALRKLLSDPCTYRFYEGEHAVEASLSASRSPDGGLLRLVLRFQSANQLWSLLTLDGRGKLVGRADGQGKIREMEWARDSSGLYVVEVNEQLKVDPWGFVRASWKWVWYTLWWEPLHREGVSPGLAPGARLDPPGGRWGVSLRLPGPDDTAQFDIGPDAETILSLEYLFPAAEDAGSPGSQQAALHEQLSLRLRENRYTRKWLASLPDGHMAVTFALSPAAERVALVTTCVLDYEETPLMADIGAATGRDLSRAPRTLEANVAIFTIATAQYQLGPLGPPFVVLGPDAQRWTRDTQVCWSPDGSRLAVAYRPPHRPGAEPMVRVAVFDTAAQCLGDADLPGTPVRLGAPVVWSPDGTRLATATSYGLWIIYMPSDSSGQENAAAPEATGAGGLRVVWASPRELLARSGGPTQPPAGAGPGTDWVRLFGATPPPGAASLGTDWWTQFALCDW